MVTSVLRLSRVLQLRRSLLSKQVLDEAVTRAVKASFHELEICANWHPMVLEHRQLNVGLQSEAVLLGVLVHHLQQVEASVDSTPFRNWLGNDR